MWRSTLDSWRVVGLCNRHLTPKYRQLVADTAGSKRVHHLRSANQIQSFLEAIKKRAESLRGTHRSGSPIAAHSQDGPAAADDISAIGRTRRTASGQSSQVLDRGDEVSVASANGNFSDFRQFSFVTAEVP